MKWTGAAKSARRPSFNAVDEWNYIATLSAVEHFKQATSSVWSAQASACWLSDWIAKSRVYGARRNCRSKERLWRWATWNENLLSNKECREHSSLDVIKKCVIKFNYSLNKVNTTLCGDSSYHTENSSSCGRIWWQQREGIELLRSSAHAINQDMMMK